jgi:hypothetical protein
MLREGGGGADDRKGVGGGRTRSMSAMRASECPAMFKCSIGASSGGVRFQPPPHLSRSSSVLYISLRLPLDARTMVRLPDEILMQVGGAPELFPFRSPRCWLTLRLLEQNTSTPTASTPDSLHRVNKPSPPSAV